MSVNPVTGVAMALAYPAYQAGAEDAPATASVQPAASPSLFYISPVVTLDDSGLAVLQWRDSSTGEVKEQIPPRDVVEHYRRHGAELPNAATAQAGEAPDDGVPELVTDPGGDQTPAENGGTETGQNVALNA